MKKNRFLLLLLLAFPLAGFSQDALNDLLKGSVADAKYLSEGYISPFLKAFGSGLNQGWYNTAKVHKFPGADLTFSVSGVMIPTADKKFTVDNTKMSSLYLSNNNNGSGPLTPTQKGDVPTFFGVDKAPTYTQKPPLSLASFSGPKGVKLNFLPVPVANLGIGLPLGIDLKFRFIPTVDLGKLTQDNLKGNLNLFGVGIMHDVKQWIPGIKNLPFDLSVFAGYTNMKLSVNLDDVKKNNKADFTSSATTIQGVISKKISVLTGYFGLGYNIAKTTVAVKGDYDFNDNGTSDPGEKDPFKIDGATSGPRVTAGLRLKLAVFAFHADYTLQKYNALTVGFGINVR